jgi:hypothetical protein
MLCSAKLVATQADMQKYYAHSTLAPIIILAILAEKYDYGYPILQPVLEF